MWKFMPFLVCECWIEIPLVALWQFTGTQWPHVNWIVEHCPSHLCFLRSLGVNGVHPQQYGQTVVSALTSDVKKTRAWRQLCERGLIMTSLLNPEQRSPDVPLSSAQRLWCLQRCISLCKYVRYWETERCCSVLTVYRPYACWMFE